MADVRATAYLGAATAALLIPDPGSTLLGWAATRFAIGVNKRIVSAAMWWAGMSVAKQSAIGYTFMTPFMLEDAQMRKEEMGVEDWDAALGQAMWEAQSIPETERLQVPQSVNPFTGGRVF